MRTRMAGFDRARRRRPRTPVYCRDPRPSSWGRDSRGRWPGPVRGSARLSAWYTALLQETYMRVRHGVVVAAVAVPLLARAADTSLLDAVRTNDSAAIRTHLASGADPNTKDGTGASALMYAAVYASPDQ